MFKYFKKGKKPYERYLKMDKLNEFYDIVRNNIDEIKPKIYDLYIDRASRGYMII